MPTKCEECGEESYCIFLTREYKKLCDVCYDKVRPDKELKDNNLMGPSGPDYRAP